MPLKPLPTHISRSGGCTLTGALSVTTHIRDATTIVHGPKGCAHHNFSLLHATGLDNGRAVIPDIVSSALTESDMVFGGEEALVRTIGAACDCGASVVFVLSTCVVDTIGDDVAEICSRDWPVPVVAVPTAGFLGGTFHHGVNNALVTVAGLAVPVEKDRSVNIIGEMNLEYEVEENYAEVLRLLTHLGLPAGVRFVHNLSMHEIAGLGAAQLNILREPSLVPVGEYLKTRFGTPYINGFPSGLSGTIAFIDAMAGACHTDSRRAVAIEQALQAEVLADFADLADAEGTFAGPLAGTESSRAAGEVAGALHIRIRDGARPIHVQPAVGTVGVRRMLHRWRRALHA